MNVTDVMKTGQVTDTRDISPHIRDTGIIQPFERLECVGALRPVAHRDPRPLRLELEASYGDRWRWTYREQGPDLWRVGRQHGRQHVSV